MGYKKPKLMWGDFAISFCNSFNVEYIYLYNYKRSLKKYRQNSLKKKTKKIWLFLHKNYPLTKKSKNARMGKGKGSLVRFCAKIKQNHNIFEFRGFSLKEIIYLKKILKRKVGFNTKIGFNFFQNKNYFLNNKNENFFCFKKYLR